jgi:hypothetical protein
LVVGGLLEFGGIVAIAWPDLLPWKERTSRWISSAYRRTTSRLLRLLGRRPPGRVFEVSGGASARVTSGAAVVTAVNEEATLEEKVAFLLRRDQKVQRDAEDLSVRIGDLEQGTPERLDEVRADLKDHFAERLAEALNRDRPLRIVGAFALGIGLTFTTLANFV